MKSLKKTYLSIYKFIVVDLWKVKLADTPSNKALLYEHLRILILTGKNYLKDDIGIKASALTYYSLLSIVPVLALIFGVAEFFGLKETLQEKLKIFFTGQEVVMQKTYEFAQTMLSTAKGGVIAGIGLLFLIYTIMRLFYSIEESFNLIWRVKRGRSWLRVLTDYLLLIILGPFILIFSVSFNVFINAQLTGLAQTFDFMHYLSPAIGFLLKLIPYVLIWLLFTLLYIIMPNTKVSFRAALIAGVLGGTIYQIVQWGYINFQVGVSRYNAIYGSFAALPLFLLWLQISWTIVLLGAEFSHAYQNIHKYGYDNKMLKLTTYSNNKLRVHIAVLIVKHFKEYEGGLALKKITGQISLPVRFIISLLEDLLQAGVISEVKRDLSEERFFLPAIDIKKMTIRYVIEKLEMSGGDELSINKFKSMKELDHKLKSLAEEMTKSPSNKLLYEI